MGEHSADVECLKVYLFGNGCSRKEQLRPLQMHEVVMVVGDTDSLWTALLVCC